MPSKLKLIKGAVQRGTLIYGMRMFPAGSVAHVEQAPVRLTDGNSRQITMHVIEGTRADIRKQLMESIDAFFELLDENPQ
jgi:hypothetical protein